MSRKQISDDFNQTLKNLITKYLNSKFKASVRQISNIETLKLSTAKGSTAGNVKNLIPSK